MLIAMYTEDDRRIEIDYPVQAKTLIETNYAPKKEAKARPKRERSIYTKAELVLVEREVRAIDSMVL